MMEGKQESREAKEDKEKRLRPEREKGEEKERGRWMMVEREIDDGRETGK